MFLSVVILILRIVNMHVVFWSVEQSISKKSLSATSDEYDG